MPEKRVFHAGFDWFFLQGATVARYYLYLQLNCILENKHKMSG